MLDQKQLRCRQAFFRSCATIVWNGPMGAFEMPPFDAATTALAKIVAAKTQNNGLMSIAGGGDTMAALANAGVSDQFSYVSTAGGAFLEWLEGKRLPGVEALRRGYFLLTAAMAKLRETDTMFFDNPFKTRLPKVDEALMGRDWPIFAGWASCCAWQPYDKS